MFEDLLKGWDGEEAVVRYDHESGAWIFVCVHSTVLGPAAGGTRLRVYPTPSDGLAPSWTGRAPRAIMRAPPARPGA